LEQQNNPDILPAVTPDCLKRSVESGAPKLQKGMKNAWDQLENWH
jgi:hypothetical protein